MGGKQKGAKKDGFKDHGGHQTSSTGAGVSTSGNLKEIEPNLKSFLQNFPQFQSRWNEGWTDQTKLLNELKAEVKKQFDNLHDEQLHIKTKLSEYHGIKIKCDCAFVPWRELEKFQIKRDDPAAVKCLLQRLETYERVIQSREEQRKTIDGLQSELVKAEAEKKEASEKLEKKNKSYKKLKGLYERLEEKGAEKDAKIAELEEQLQKLHCEVNDRNGRRGEEPAKEITKAKIYAFDLNDLGNAERFDYEMKKWQEIDLGGALTGRTNFGLANIGHKLFVTGGEIYEEVTKNCEVINLTQSGEVQTVKSFYDLNTERDCHCALSIGDKIYVFGGRNDIDNLSSIECSDGIGTWAEMGNLCDKRCGSTGAVLDGVAFVIGGKNVDGQNALNSMERFDPREGNKCVPMKAMKESRLWAAATVHKGLIYVTGGNCFVEKRERVRVFGAKVFGRICVDGRIYVKEVNESREQIFVAVGRNKKRLDTVEIYDSRRNKWTDGPNMNIGRYGHSLVSDGNRLLAIGGDDHQTMEELVDGTWTIHSDKAPFDRQRAIII